MYRITLSLTCTNNRHAKEHVTGAGASGLILDGDLDNKPPSGDIGICVSMVTAVAIAAAGNLASGSDSKEAPQNPPSTP